MEKKIVFFGQQEECGRRVRTERVVLVQINKRDYSKNLEKLMQDRNKKLH